MGITTVPHRPYSPDLAPCDFWLFPMLKSCRYESIEEMKKAVTKVIDTLTQEDFHGVFQKLLERYNKCIAAGEDEHQFLSGIRDSKKALSLWGMVRGVGGVRKSIHQSWLAKGLGLGLLCWGSKGVQEEAVVMRQLRRWKMPWRRSLTRSHKRTSMGPSRTCWNGSTNALQAEEITSKGTRVLCVYYQ